MAIGPILRNARQMKQLTTSQVAEITRMKVQIVDDLEKDDFHRVAATIYGKGFIKLFAECVELDPEPLIADYMAQMGAPPPQKLPAKPEPVVPLPIPEAETMEDDPETAVPEDLFAYASKPRRNKTSTRSTVTAAPPTTARSNDAPSPWTTVQQSCRQTQQKIVAALDTGIQKITEKGAHDEWIQRGLIALGVLVLLLILIPIGRAIFSRATPRSLPDNELILLVPPPEPYLE
jgi:hypothetical protein